LAKRLAKAFQETLALRVPVKLVETGALPRFELKAKRWVAD
jgi:phenylacetate-coenzyme A ligase PaaK-like adenylate-forming protein